MAQSRMRYRLLHLSIVNVLEVTQTCDGFEVLTSYDIARPGVDVFIEFQIIPVSDEHTASAELNFFELGCWAMVFFRDRVYYRDIPNDGRFQLHPYDGDINTPENLAGLRKLFAEWIKI